MIRAKGRRPLTCHHEAGHALVRWYFGYGTDRAMVQTYEEYRAGKRVRDRRGRLVTCEGLVTGYDIYGQPWGRIEFHGSLEDAAWIDQTRTVSREIELTFCLAGFYAEAAYTRRSVGGCMLDGGTMDMKGVSGILNVWYEDENEARRTASLVAEARISSRAVATRISRDQGYG